MRLIRYTIPSLFSLLALLSAFYAILLSIDNQFVNACYCIIASMLFDSLDGRVARLLNSSTAFGAALDSIVDMMAYGVAPGMMMYCWHLHALGRFGFIVAFIMCLCAGLRLARFNIMLEVQDSRFFQGLSSTMAGGLVISFILSAVQYSWMDAWVVAGAVIITLLSALLMVSNVKFYSFKAIGKYKKVILTSLITIMVILIALIPWLRGLSVMIFIGGYVVINLLLQPLYKRM